MKNRISAALAALLLLAPGAAGAEDSFVEAVKAGKPLLNFRLRYEHVEQDGLDKDANALTLRSRVGYQTGWFKNFQATVEFENIANLGKEKYNNTLNGRTTYPVVADPEVTEVNQVYATVRGLADTTIYVGRKRWKLGNDRFVGNVGFRQNEQTFDSAVLVNKSVKNLTAVYGYVWNVNRIFSGKHPAGDLNTDTHIINLSYKTPYGSLTGYGYVLDIDAAAALSSSTFGARFAGKTDAGSNGFKILYALEAAFQSDSGNNPVDYSANYYLVEPGVAYKGFTLKLGYEVLEGDGVGSFKTPLATLHAFQGFTDKFLVTPPDGIEDLYVKASYKVPAEGALKGLSIRVHYHGFQAENGGMNYGSEWSAKIAKSFKTDYGKFALSLEHADYDADGFSVDTSKTWVTLGLSY